MLVAEKIKGQKGSESLYRSEVGRTNDSAAFSRAVLVLQCVGARAQAQPARRAQPGIVAAVGEQHELIGLGSGRLP
jgi:hypothetical protein